MGSRSIIVAILLLATSHGLAAAGEKRTGLLCGQLIDGKSERPIKNAGVLIEGERIVAVGSPDVIPAGTEVIDLGAATLMPGFIDAHAHPLIQRDSYQTYHLRWSSAYNAFIGLKAVQRELENGWTSLRIPGDADVYYAHLEIRRVIQDGLFVGPRIAGAGHYISVTGDGGGRQLHLPGAVRDR